MMNSAPAAQTILILDDDPIVADSLAAALERPGRNIIMCNDAESAQLVIEWLSPTHIISDIHVSGKFGYEGLDIVRYAKKQVPDCRTILMTGDHTEALEAEAAQRGAAGFVKKPFRSQEIETLIGPLDEARAARLPARTIRLPLLDEVLSGSDLYPLFEPLVLLDKWTPFALEVTTHLRSDSPLANPERLSAYAEKKERVAELETARIRIALAAAAPLLDRALLFVNVHPSLFEAGRALSDLFIDYSDSAIRMERIVLEVTEQSALKNGREVLANVERMRELGINFAFDDFGASYSHLPLISEVRPAFLKASAQFGKGLGGDLTKVRVVTNFLAMARDFGCELIVNGIDETAGAEAAARLGVKYGQGPLFGKPTPSSAFTKAASVAR